MCCSLKLRRIISFSRLVCRPTASEVRPRMRADGSGGAGGDVPQEAKHFTLLSNRLKAMGSEYGAVRPHATSSSVCGSGRVEGGAGAGVQLTAHDGLWESAWETADSLEARLAVEHCVHEVGRPRCSHAPHFIQHDGWVKEFAGH
jgi:hypothetical protein